MKVVVKLSKEEMESYKKATRLGIGNSAMRKIINGTPLPDHLASPVNKAVASDVLTVSFESSLKDGAGLCVARKSRKNTVVIKTVIGEQADILYYLLTEQSAKAESEKGAE